MQICPSLPACMHVKHVTVWMSFLPFSLKCNRQMPALNEPLACSLSPKLWQHGHCRSSEIRTVVIRSFRESFSLHSGQSKSIQGSLGRVTILIHKDAYCFLLNMWAFARCDTKQDGQDISSYDSTRKSLAHDNLIGNWGHSECMLWTCILSSRLIPVKNDSILATSFSASSRKSCDDARKSKCSFTSQATPKSSLKERHWHIPPTSLKKVARKGVTWEEVMNFFAIRTTILSNTPGGIAQ